MTQWEYVTHLVPLQGGEVKRGPKGEWLGGLTTEFLNDMGREGWELIGCFPWVIQAGSALAVTGDGALQQRPGIFCVFKRCLGADTRPGGGPARTATVGGPRYGG